MAHPYLNTIDTIDIKSCKCCGSFNLDSCICKYAKLINEKLNMEGAVIWTPSALAFFAFGEKH